MDITQVQNSDKSDFSKEQLCFIGWLAMPKSKRKPKTQKQLADQLGYDEDTLCDWKGLPGFEELHRQKIEQLAGEDDADIIEALKASARIRGKDGASDRKTYLQWRGWLVQKVAQTKPDGTELDAGHAQQQLESALLSLRERAGGVEVSNSSSSETSPTKPDL